MDRKQIKIDAREALKGNWPKFMLFTIAWSVVLSLIITVASVLMSVVGTALKSQPAIASVINLIIGIFLMVISLGWTGASSVAMCKNAMEMWNCMAPEFGQIFNYTKYVINCIGLFWAIIWRMILFGWIPILNVVVMLNLSMIWYVKADNPYMKAKFCVKRSKELMKGHRIEFFIFNLSFFLWYMLGSVTCGIGYFYVIPYLLTATAGYYEYLKSAPTTQVVEEVDMSSNQGV